MPGILPMKVIKVGSNAQSRIAQACDRCRSKKIRCDGIRPCCTQCANVGFECRTSDKLSRRAFPRGYTESLEERVRSLEAEVRELKDLLEEKEEKIDILSKIHSDSKSSTVSSPSMDSTRLSESMDDVFTVETSPLLFSSDDSDSYFMGASSGRAFVDAFKRRIHECGKSCAAFNADAFLNLHHETKNLTLLTNASLTPPRLFTDRMVNIFFQEWAPLFPILHKPTFLRMYERFVEDPEQTAEKHQLAQLYLVFGIALVSSEAPDREQLVLCESRWRSAVLDILLDNSIATMQCLILAQLFCIAKGDYKHLQHYKAMAVGLSGRLGLHQNQKQFPFDALTIEKRKRVFWSLYTIDRFSAASLGLPKLLTEADVLTEYPADIDDDDTLEKGSQPTLPGEHTKISSALALFRVSRILSKVLEKNYPAATSHDLSHASIGALEMELKNWSASLPNHLKLTFIQDKPSPDIIGHRCPLLFLAFYYIRTLIHRPVIGSCPPPKSSSSAIALAESSKRIIQITRLLRHRHLVFSLCLNKDEVLTLCGLSLLYQRLDLKQDGRLMRDGQELVQEVIVSLAKSNASGAADFTKLAVSMGIKDPLESRPEVSSGIPVSNHGLVSSAAEKERLSDVTQTQNQQHRIITASQIDNVSPSDLENRPHDHPFSKTPIPTIARTRYQPKPPPIPKSRPNNRLKARKQNLDYLPLDINIPGPFQNQSSGPEKKNDTEKERESRKHEHDGWQSIPILGSVDEAQIYDAMYGGTSLPLSLCERSSSSSGGGSAVDSEGSRDYARSSGSGHSGWSSIGVEGGGGGGGAGFEGGDRMEFRCDGRALMRVKAEGMDVRGEGGGDGDGDADMDVDVEGFGLEDGLNRW